MNSFSGLGNTYKHPQYEEDINEADTFLAGSFEFYWMKLKSIIKKNKN